MNRITLVLLLLISSLSCSVIENTIEKKEKDTADDLKVLTLLP
ncbi:putative lipoprotein [Leptospira borgpetersenii serovar Mini str. 201000851]|uniref:Lipoprotein n=2 Tax=Leptospira borgpetersenii TaxID=174 RepID=A0ABP2S5A2_LEPBO|nr:putative lipoprotein [Leptospira borgpetersenii str. 200801926]EMF97878.1 putative lipoprotein [Leptospira borgpetersenii str. 200701203]ENO64995.1 putative lipoprotein [Leptospira borgpetersenii serovar Mini str. 201000851]